MKILIVGATGFIGRHLLAYWSQKGHSLTGLARGRARLSVPYMQADLVRPGEWQKKVSEFDVVVNLVGRPIDPPWTEHAKNSIRESRVLATTNLASSMHSGQLLISTSAIGYYGFCGDEFLDESSPGGSDFLARVCRSWEKSAIKAKEKGVRVIVARLGIVLGYGGVLEKMVKMLRHFMGRRLGSGKQWFSWVHMEDLSMAFSFFAEGQPQRDVYNICSPHPVQNEELMRIIARIIGKPSSLPLPAGLLKFTLGEFAALILEGQRVQPLALTGEGCKFRYPHIEDALEDLLREFRKTNSLRQ